MLASPAAPPKMHPHMQPSPPMSPPASALRLVETKGRMYHNAVYYRYDGRSPSTVLEPQITSIVYYSAIVFDDHGRIYLANPGQDTRDVVDGVPGGVIRACTNMKRINQQLKIVLSLDVHSETNFRRLLAVAADVDRRKIFCATARHLVDLHGVDGIDQTREQGNILQTLLVDLRNILEAPTYWLSIALSGDDWSLTYLDMAKISPIVDLFNVMCFDFIPKNSTLTGHASALFGSDNQYCNFGDATDCHSSLRKLEASGAPLDKVMLCISSLGHVFHGARGPGQPFSSVARVPYSRLPLPGSNVTEDARLGLAYCVDDKEAMYVSYDNRLTVDMKANYVRANGLAGVALKRANFDVREEGLVNAAYRALHPAV